MRTIPIALQDHLEQAATTLCLLLKYVCRDGTVFGFTSHDRDVVYDDGLGPVTYLARVGVEVSNISASSELGVDNAEASGLIPVFDLPGEITAADVNGGKLDYAEFWLWVVNYTDLDTSGSPYEAKHAELMCGTAGQVRTDNDQLAIPELLSLSQQMQQTFVPETSITCRTFLGSDICGVDVEALYEDFTVLAVGLESDRTFTIDLDHPDGFYQPGLVQWYTGANAGYSDQVEGNTATGDSPGSAEVTLSIAAHYVIQVGDTGRIRKDCRKRYLEDCIGIYANGLNFDAEPNIPMADEDIVNIGGAES